MPSLSLFANQISCGACCNISQQKHYGHRRNVFRTTGSTKAKSNEVREKKAEKTHIHNMQSDKKERERDDWDGDREQDSEKKQSVPDKVCKYIEIKHDKFSSDTDKMFQCVMCWVFVYIYIYISQLHLNTSLTEGENKQMRWISVSIFYMCDYGYRRLRGFFARVLFLCLNLFQLLFLPYLIFLSLYYLIPN